jgi:hypothetical protein
LDSFGCLSVKGSKVFAIEVIVEVSSREDEIVIDALNYMNSILVFLEN